MMMEEEGDGDSSAKEGHPRRFRHNCPLFWTTLKTWKQRHQTTEGIIDFPEEDRLAQSQIEI